MQLGYGKNPVRNSIATSPLKIFINVDDYMNCANNKLPLFLCFSLSLVVLYGVLDGVRDTFLPGYVPLSLLRDISVFLFFFTVFLYAFKEKHKLEVLIIISAISFLTLISLVNTVLIDEVDLYRRVPGTLSDDMGFWSKTLFFLLLSIAFYLLFSKKPSSLNCFFLIYILFSLFYCFLTLSVIFIFPDYYNSLPQRNWWGRLSIGYPTLDVFILSCSLIVVYFKDLMAIKKVSIIAILSLVLFMQNNVTGFLLYFIFLAAVFFHSRLMCKFFSLLFLFFIVGVGFYVYSNSGEYGDLGWLLKSRVDFFLFGRGDNTSVSLRLEQMRSVLDVVFSSPYYLIFGYGAAGGFSVENTFFSIFSYVGIVGFLLFSLLVVFCFSRIFFLRDKVCFWLLVMFLVSSLSVVTLYLFPTLMIFSVIVSLVLSKTNASHYI